MGTPTVAKPLPPLPLPAEILEALRADKVEEVRLCPPALVHPSMEWACQGPHVPGAHTYTTFLQVQEKVCKG